MANISFVFYEELRLTSTRTGAFGDPHSSPLRKIVQPRLQAFTHD
jgi:hypothetical protein